MDRLHEFFERCVRDSPDALALDIPPGHGRQERQSFTYRELAARSIAAQMRLAGRVQGECLVALLLPRTDPDAFAMQLGVLRAGAAYVCIDPTFPDERIAALLTNAEPVAMVTNAVGAERLARIGVSADLVIDVDAAPLRVPAEAHRAEPELPAWSTGSTLAYVIYTSGTTGTPKGVAIEHRAIVNLIASDRDAFGLTSADRVGQGSSHAYDSSVEEIWLAWAAGAAVVVMDDAAVRLGPDLVDWIDRERLTVLCPPPTLLRSMGLRDAAGLLPRLSLVYVGGEALPQDIVDSWAPGRRLVNGYGPTECAVTTLRADITVHDPISIGRPIPGVQAWALDAALAPVADGAEGELCLGGVALARGYWRDPAMTARKFIEHPTLGRLYRTGDIAHRLPDGSFICHGRTDTQVKIRGYRVELEEIETHLSRVPGVRAAACRVELRDQRQVLTAFLVAADPAAPPEVATLRQAMSALLPKALVPAAYVFLDTLPLTVGGKLNRAALPTTVFDEPAAGASRPVASLGASDDALETWITAAMQRVLRTTAPIAPDADFFADLGGDSLAAAELAVALGEARETEAITVGDLYGGPTVRQIAARARAIPPVAPASMQRPRLLGARPVRTTVVQALLLIALTVIGSWIGFAVVFRAAPAVVDAIGLLQSTVVAIGLGFAAIGLYVPLAALIAILLKRLLIGRYVPMQTPVWGAFYLRHWIVMRAVALIPWSLLEGTRMQIAILRALGARIGRGVHIHRGVRLTDGGWDLLEIGDDVSIGQDAQLHLADLDNGALVIAPVTLEHGATLEVRSGVGGGARIGRGACLAALSWLPSGASIPQGERWSGVPAERVGAETAPPLCTPTLSARQFDARLLGARLGLALLFVLPYEIAALSVLAWDGSGAAALLSGQGIPHPATFALLLVILGPLPLVTVIALKALVSRALGVVPEGSISRWSSDYVRVMLKTELLNTAGLWLSGTLMWPMWLRAAGMRVGRDCEISTIIDVVPEHVEIGDSSFFADGIYLGGARVSQGTVTLQRTTLGRGVFIGNHAVIRAGQRIADGVLIGVSTTIDDGAAQAGSAWFGQPAFAIRRRPPDDADRRVTYEPSAIRYINRWLWELLRFALPMPLLAATFLWSWALGAWTSLLSGAWTWLAVVPAVTFAYLASFPLGLLILKWALLGRVRPGRHPLWSCWCSRWDFLYVAWGQLVQPVLVGLEGTLLLSAYLRAMGMTIGRRVVLGPGFSQVVDPDMLHFGDDSTVQCMFQAHTFEDRILKIDTVHIGAGASVGQTSVMMNGSVAGDGTQVTPHTVVMKHARLTAGRRYEGCPSRLAARS
jgi:non-ribosomal peptide synthetase-like protein